MAQLVYDASFYEQQEAGSLSSARAVLPILWEYWQPHSVVDVGCGTGAWLQAATEQGAEQILGIDGDYVDRAGLMFDQARFLSRDLSETLNVGERYDLAISVEVAEHLPFSRAESFVADLAALSDTVLFSAALPYQGGVNHINEQWLEFWAILFRRHQYVPCDLFRRRVWADHRVEFWYSQNLLLFCKRGPAADRFPLESLATNRALSCPHPLTFLVNVNRYRPLALRALDLEFEDYKKLVQAYLSGDCTLPPLGMLKAMDGGGANLFPAARVRMSDAGAELASRDGEIQRLSADVAAERREGERLRYEISILRQEMQSSRLALTQEAARISELLGARTSEMQHLAEQMDARAREISRLKSELAAREEAVRHASAVLTDRDARLYEIERSLTWRLTRPIRRIGPLLSHGKSNQP